MLLDEDSGPENLRLKLVEERNEFLQKLSSLQDKKIGIDQIICTFEKEISISRNMSS
jgi:hypothetical protein